MHGKVADTKNIQLHLQSSWSTHKQTHKPGSHTWAYVTQKGRGRNFSLPSFDWTGPLRPMMVSPYREVPCCLLSAGFISGSVQCEPVVFALERACLLPLLSHNPTPDHTYLLLIAGRVMGLSAAAVCASYEVPAIGKHCCRCHQVCHGQTMQTQASPSARWKVNSRAWVGSTASAHSFESCI